MEFFRTPEHIRKENLESLADELKKAMAESGQVEAVDSICIKVDRPSGSDVVDGEAHLPVSTLTELAAPKIKSKKQYTKKSTKSIDPICQGKGPQKKLKIKLRETIAGWFSQIYSGDRILVSGLTGKNYSEITGQKRFGRGMERATAIKHIRGLANMVGSKIIVCGNLKKNPTLLIKQKKGVEFEKRYVLGYINDIDEFASAIGSDSSDTASMTSIIRSSTFKFDAVVKAEDSSVTIGSGDEHYEFMFPFHSRQLSAALDDMENNLSS